MAGKREIATIYVAGVAQGIALVTFPAASAIFISPEHYDLSKTQYGAMFLPQAITAIIASLLGAGLTRRLGAKRLYLFGLVADILAMALLVFSQFVQGDHTLAYIILLVATGCLGVGFGLTVPALNTLAAALLPQKVDQAVLVLNALLGLGTALAPVFVSLFVGLGIWWGLPVSVAVLLLAILLFSLRLPLATTQLGSVQIAGQHGLPAIFWLFAVYALLYGIIETLNGNWATLYMTDLGASAALASLALTVFWGTVTAGRVLFAFIDHWLSERRVYRWLPLLAALAFVLLAWLHTGQELLGILAFGLAGLGCSALLPLTISFGQRTLTTMSASAAGALIAAYQTGYGIAAFGGGALQENAGVPMATIFLAGAVVAVVLFAVGFLILRRTAAAPAAAVAAATPSPSAAKPAAPPKEQRK